MSQPLHTSYLIRSSKPYFRGKLHRLCLIIFGIVGPIHLAMRRKDPMDLFPLALFYITNVYMYGVSSFYHLNHWGTEMLEYQVTQADHAAIYMCVGGNISLILLTSVPNTHKYDSMVNLIAVWASIFAGILKSALNDHSSRIVNLVYYMLICFIGLPLLPAILAAMHWHNRACILAGFVMYCAAATFYAFKVPDPWPAYWGYHEFFHAAIVLGNTFILLTVCL